MSTFILRLLLYLVMSKLEEKIDIDVDVYSTVYNGYTWSRHFQVEVIVYNYIVISNYITMLYLYLVFFLIR